MHGCDGRGGFLLSVFPVLGAPGALGGHPSAGARGGGAAARLLIQQAGPRWLARYRPAVGVRSPGAVKYDGDL